jgi:P-type Ca2+ transporter type 2C
MTADIQSNKSPREKTPIQILMKTVAANLAKVAILCALVIPVLGILRGVPWKSAMLYGMSLAFATIPEELPVIVKKVLAVSIGQLHPVQHFHRSA